MTVDDLFEDVPSTLPEGEASEATLKDTESPAESPGESSDDSPPPLPSDLCENCRAFLQGPFCHQCGQSDRPLDLSLGAFAKEWLGSVFGFDGRVWRTLTLLLRRPGALSREYLQGRRARYVSPLRLYFFISLAAFLILATTDASMVDTSEGSGLSVELDATDLEESLPGVLDNELDVASEIDSDSSPATPSPEAPTNPAANDGASDGTNPATTSEDSDEAFEAAAEKVVEKAIETATQDNENLSKEFLRHLPKAIFFLVPFYAWLLKLFFRRRYRSFLQHLVVSLHLHTTAFVLITLGHLVDVGLGFSQQGSDPGQSIAALILIVHTFMTLRHVYGDRRRVLLLKYAVLSMAHITALGFVMLINLFFAFYQMGAFD